MVIPGEPDPPSYPLRAYFCHSCTLVQIDTTIPKETMFGGAYPYVSGTTDTLVQHFAESAARLSAEYLKPGDLVVDIGSNDGTWLAHYSPDIRTVGVEPSNVPANVTTYRKFFNLATAEEIASHRGNAKLITAAGVFFHLEDLHGVIEGVKHLLSDDGVFVIQVIYLGGMIENGAFDQIYHEHLCYYSLASLSNLLFRHDLFINKVMFHPIHGGTLEVHCGRQAHEVIDGLADVAKKENALRLSHIATYHRFAADVADTGVRLLDTLERFRAQGRTVYAYGAPAKGATLLNSFGIRSDLVQCAVEKNPLKFGKLMPGSRIPIIDEADAPKPDVYLLLAWNFRDEILAKEAEFLAAGGKMIVPFPRFEVIG